MAVVHQPVLVSECLQLLEPKPDGIYVDVTLGNGGHALSILEASAPSGRLIGIDQDEEILKVAQERLASFKDRVGIHQANFTNLVSILEKEGRTQVHGILADLGVSSLQLERGERGFSFQREGPIDMRMNPREGENAWQKLRRSNVVELTQVLQEFGEERLAPKIARAVIDKVKRNELKTTKDLADLVFYCYPPKGRHQKIHPATRTFQALRLWVNQELQNLKILLETAPPLLAKGGRLCIISYHSLEDRMVKQHFRRWAKEEGGFELLTKKPIQATGEEILRNPRCRSAKLRGLQKGMG